MTTRRQGAYVRGGSTNGRGREAAKLARQIKAQQRKAARLARRAAKRKNT